MNRLSVINRPDKCLYLDDAIVQQPIGEFYLPERDTNLPILQSWVCEPCEEEIKAITIRFEIRRPIDGYHKARCRLVQTHRIGSTTPNNLTTSNIVTTSNGSDTSSAVNASGLQSLGVAKMEGRLKDKYLSHVELFELLGVGAKIYVRDFDAVGKAIFLLQNALIDDSDFDPKQMSEWLVSNP